MRNLTFILALLGMSSAASDAYAWGNEGHQIVCQIAFDKLTPPTQAKINQLLKVTSENMPAFSTFAEACTWPDHPRKRAPEHFVNLSRDATSLTNTCGVAQKCVVAAIAEDLAILSSKTASDIERSESLKFLGHWVGDVHQPLHVSFEDDRGGNNVDVSGKCSPNMHSTWDTCLVRAVMQGKDIDDTADKLRNSITKAQRKEWIQSDPQAWANESFKISESPTTKYCAMNGNECTKPESTVTIDQAYIETNAPIAAEELQRAGIRLAHLLDQALGD